MNKLFSLTATEVAEEKKQVPAISFEEAVAGLESLDDTVAVEELDMYQEAISDGFCAIEALADTVTRISAVEELTPELAAAEQANVSYVLQSIGAGSGNEAVPGLEGMELYSDVAIAGIEENKDSIAKRAWLAIKELLGKMAKFFSDNRFSKYISEKFGTVYGYLSSKIGSKEMEVNAKLGFKDVDELAKFAKDYKATCKSILKAVNGIDVKKAKLDTSEIKSDSSLPIHFDEDMKVVNNTKFGTSVKVKTKTADKYVKILKNMGVTVTKNGDSFKASVGDHPALKAIEKVTKELAKLPEGEVDVNAVRKLTTQLRHLGSYVRTGSKDVTKAVTSIASGIKEAKAAKKSDKAKDKAKDKANEDK